MEIKVKLKELMKEKKVSLNELSEEIGITLANLSILRTGKAKAIRFSTLAKLCKALNCQPGELIEYVDDKK